jgi:hypothetical protein
MKLNSKVTWGLAWTGLAVVLAVPSVDFLTGKLGTPNNAAVVDSTAPASAVVETAKIPSVEVETPVADAEPAKPTGVTTTLTDKGVVITPAGGTPPADAVAKFEQSGKALPDYISGGSDTASAPTTPAARTDTTQLASLGSVTSTPDIAVPPVPFPTRPADPVRAAAAKPPVVNSVATRSDPVVIVDESRVTPPANIVAAPPTTPTRPVPPAPIADDSANWRGNGLEQYLDRSGLLDNSRSSASVTVVDRSSDYDPNGFYLSDGPNDSRAARRARLEQLFDETDDGYDVPQRFNLF